MQIKICTTHYPTASERTAVLLSTDKATEEAILEVIKAAFPDHLVLGEEGGVSGGPNSDYLWCIDPLGESLPLVQRWIDSSSL